MYVDILVVIASQVPFFSLLEIARETETRGAELLQLSSSHFLPLLSFLYFTVSDTSHR